MRIRWLSLNKKIFHEISKMYIEALKNSGFKEEFTYLEIKMILIIIVIYIMIKKLSYNDKNNCNIKVNCQKIEKGKLYDSTPF